MQIITSIFGSRQGHVKSLQVFKQNDLILSLFCTQKNNNIAINTLTLSIVSTYLILYGLNVSTKEYFGQK